MHTLDFYQAYLGQLSGLYYAYFSFSQVNLDDMDMGPQTVSSWPFLRHIKVTSLS